MNDDKKQQLATAVKWGVGLLAAASIAIVVRRSGFAKPTTLHHSCHVEIIKDPS